MCSHLSKSEKFFSEGLYSIFLLTLALKVKVSQSCLIICNSMDCSTPGFPVLLISRILLKLMSIKSGMLCSHLILCCPLLLLPSIFFSIRVFYIESPLHLGSSQVMLVIKYLPANAGDIRDTVLIPESGRFPGEAYGNPLQYSCLESPMDRGNLWSTVHGVTWIQT